MPFPKGIFSDTQEAAQPEGSYRYARNIIDSNVLGVKENEDGFLAIEEQAPYDVNGIIPIERDFVVFSTDNTDSEIGLMTRTGNALVYTQIYNDPDLAFSTDAPIKGEFRKDVNGDRVITWIDNNNVPRTLNIDDLSGIDDINDLALFQDVNNPSISSSSINDTGGTLPTGAIVVFTRYKNPDGSVTNPFVHDHVFYINDDSKSLAFNVVDGAPTGTISNKSISITFAGSDTRFNTLVVGYIHSTNGILNAYEVQEVNNGSTLTVTITGTESKEIVALEEVLVPSTNYTNAKAITQLGGRLFLANLTASELPELQEVANAIVVNYTTDPVNVIATTLNHKDNLPPTLIPGEVYALYLGVELKKGGWAFYHIPGRAPGAGEVASTTSEGMTYLKYQVEDTVAGSTNLNFWENVNELYPNKVEFSTPVDLRGLAVRHHRMPTLDRIRTTDFPAEPSFGIQILPRLGLDITNVIIPSDIQDQITRWKIFYAKKDTTNSLVIGSDLLQFGVPTATDSTVRWSTGGNWALQGEPTGTDDWEDFNTPQTDTLRGHCLDLLLNQTSNTPTYSWFYYKLRRSNVNTQYTGFGSTGGKITITGLDRGSNTSAVIDFTTSSSVARSGTGFFKRIDNFKYLPSNAIDGKFRTSYTEGVYVADINNPSTSFSGMAFDTLLTNSGSQGPDANPWSGAVGGEDTMYMQYFKLLSDAHVGFTNQQLIPLESYASPSTTSLSDVFGGDGFLSYMSYLAAGPNNANPEATQTDPFEEGTRVWKAYIGYSRNNFNYRHQEAGNVPTFYYGKTDVRNLFTPYANNFATNHQIKFKLDAGVNEISYDRSFSQMNEFEVGTIWSSSLIQETNFPNTIIYSPIQSADTKEYSWRTFLAADKHVMPKNKGEIVNLQGFKNNELFIHHKYTLFKTLSNVRVGTDAESAFITSGTLFDTDPIEIIPASGGYAGTQNKFACVLTKAGYAFVDDIQGKIFLFTGDDLEEVSSNGQRIFFRDFMKIGSANTDNPFTEVGYSLVFDEKFNRIIITKKYDSLSWTWSYNPSQKTWTSSHDYIGDYMFSTVDNTAYILKDNSFFFINVFDTGVLKGQYFDSTIYPSSIDVVHNPEPVSNKHFTGVNWITEVYPSSYTNGQPSTVLDYNTTFDHLTLHTVEHCTGRITLSRIPTPSALYQNNLRQKKRTWYFDRVRDVVSLPGFLQGFYDNYEIDTTKLDTNSPWYEQRRFIDKFVSCRYEFDNTSNKRLLFIDSQIEYKNEE